MRAWDDFVVSSHLAFLPAVVLALVRGLWDSAVLIIVMVLLSIWYHREAEKNQFIAKIELCSTCALFIYGASQGFYAPSAPMLAAEVICASISRVFYTHLFCTRRSVNGYAGALCSPQCLRSP